MFAKILLGLIMAIVALGFLAEWYYHWIRRVQPVDNSDPFAVPDLDKYAVEDGSPTPRAEAFFRANNEAASKMGMTLAGYSALIIKSAAESPYPTNKCLTESELENVAKQRFGLISPREADHAYHCKYCRSGVLWYRSRGPR